MYMYLQCTPGVVSFMIVTISPIWNKGGPYSYSYAAKHLVLPVAASPSLPCILYSTSLYLYCPNDRLRWFTRLLAPRALSFLSS